MIQLFQKLSVDCQNRRSSDVLSTKTKVVRHHLTTPRTKLISGKLLSFHSSLMTLFLTPPLHWDDLLRHSWRHRRFWHVSFSGPSSSSVGLQICLQLVVHRHLETSVGWQTRPLAKCLRWERARGFPSEYCEGNFHRECLRGHFRWEYRTEKSRTR